MTNSAKLRAYIGFSIKSRHIVYGYDAVMAHKGVHLVVASPDINRTAKQELQAYCEEKRIPLRWCPQDILQENTAKKGCKCIGLLDASLAKAANEELTRLQKGESNE